VFKESSSIVGRRYLFGNQYMTFKSLGLSSPLLKAIQDSGYAKPTPVQKKTIPMILNRSDMVVSARTGTGKTAGFTLPILELLNMRKSSRKNGVKALILCPTRELADQIHKSIKLYGKYLNISATVVYGGVSMNPQKASMKKGVDVLVATPGRLLDLISQKLVNFKSLEFFVLDEADRMLDMGFIKDIETITSLLPVKRQNLLFSATFSPVVKKLTNRIAKKSIEVDMSSRVMKVREISEKFYLVNNSKKTEILCYFIKEEDWYQALIFVRTKYGADNLVRRIRRRGLEAVALHGNKTQSQRRKAIEDFRRNKVRLLVATDIAARGIDVEGLSHVVNYNLPSVPEDYVHRVGRTGRAGNRGVAISLVSAEEKRLLTDIERFVGFKAIYCELPLSHSDAQKSESVGQKSKEKNAPKSSLRKRPAKRKSRRRNAKEVGG
tara:strand:+ start:28 stop:1338 length:1311 start_codon:yes stop_codon:yes gene_type:complete